MERAIKYSQSKLEDWQEQLEELLNEQEMRKQYGELGNYEYESMSDNSQEEDENITENNTWSEQVGMRKRSYGHHRQEGSCF